MTVHALDDYEATLDVAVLSEPGVMLATQVDGKAIDIASGGPVRLVFPPSSKEGKDSDLWVPASTRSPSNERPTSGRTKLTRLQKVGGLLIGLVVGAQPINISISRSLSRSNEQVVGWRRR